MNPEVQDFSWRIGGPQGSGVDSAARMFAQAFAMGGLEVFGRREYYSNIKGRHSYYDIRVSERTHRSHRDQVHLLTTFEAESLARHALAVVEGGGILYDEKSGEVPLERITFLDRRVREDLRALLQEHQQPETTAGLLHLAREKGVHLFPIPYSQLTADVASEAGVPAGLAQRTLNTLAVALSAALLRFPKDFVKEAVARIFRGKDKVIALNVVAVDVAYRFVEDTFQEVPFHFRLSPREGADPRILVNGTQAVAMGKIAFGLTFQTYYPISPATDESVYLEAHRSFPLNNGQEGSVVVVQTEDEISAITMATGAALAGARSATATSGPGFALMVEGLGWAGINEVPVVITLYQRGGPSTGMPTRTEQGDLHFVVEAGHGEFPRLVLASGDLEEAFLDAGRALNYAEQFQMPVIHLLDKALSSTTQTVPPFRADALPIDRGKWAHPDSEARPPFPRFQDSDDGISPRVIPGTPGGQHWVTGGEHTVEGRVTEDPVIRVMQMDKRARKLTTVLRTLSQEEKFRVWGDPGAAFTLLSWGSTKGVILDTLELFQARGIPLRFIQVRLLAPFPAEELQPLLATASPLVDVELNGTGQLARILRMETGRDVDFHILKYTGRPISVEELTRALEQILNGTAQRRIVLMQPFE